MTTHTIKLITDQEAETYICTCGNAAWLDGFYPVDPTTFNYYGDDPDDPAPPPNDAAWHGHFKCFRCGAIDQLA